MDERLARCMEEIRALKEENRLLREAAEAFGALADRLNAKLKERRARGESVEPAGRRDLTSK